MAGYFCSGMAGYVVRWPAIFFSGMGGYVVGCSEMDGLYRDYCPRRFIDG
jgi:hypothetical protein